MKKFFDKKIGVLMGGMSAERAVSLKSGEAIAAALSRLGYQQIPILVDQNIPETLKRERIEVAFIALHGRYGEDGAIQGLLEIMHIPYTGSGVTASALAMNKIASHDVFRAHQLPLPPAFILEEKMAPHFQIASLDFGFPVVVKPVSEGSSIGVSIVQKEDDMIGALKNAFAYGTKVIIEKYISGKEVHVGILNNRPLGAIEVQPKGAFYDYSAKYIPGLSAHVFPAALPRDIYQAVLDLGLQAHEVLGCCGYSRVDLLLKDGMDPLLLEVNTLPGMTETSLMPEMARGIGIDFDPLVEQILETAGIGK